MKNKTLKQQTVKEVSDALLEKSKKPSTVVLNYSQITSNEINELRSILQENNAKLRVIKNTLIKRILQRTGVTLQKDLEGQNAIIITTEEDFVPALKTIYNYTRTLTRGNIQLGVLHGDLISNAQVQELSKLPSRDILISQVVGGLSSPIRGFAYVLNGVQNNFVRTLDAIKSSKN